MSGGNDRGGYWRVLLCARCNALCACPSVSFSLGRVWETENGRAAGMTSACRGGHGGETRRVKVGRGCGPQRRVGVCPESLGPRRPSTPPHTPPPGGRISGLKDNEWKRCNVRPQPGGGNGWPGARCSDAARRDATLLPEAWCDLLVSCFPLLSPAPLLRYLLCINQTNPCLWCTLPSLFY